MKYRALLLASTILLGGCAVGPDYQSPDYMVDKWIDQQTHENVVTAWWQTFEDPLLNEIVSKVAANNLDIQVARARIKEARALRTSARASLLPVIGFGASAAREKQSLNNPNFIQAPDIDINQIETIYELGFDASWEIDIFGGNRRALEAATARHDRAKAIKRFTILSMVADAVRTYIELRGEQSRLVALSNNIALQTQTVDVTEASFLSGIVPRADLARAKSLLAQTKALVPNRHAEIRAASYQLAVLMGEAPGSWYEKLSTYKPVQFLGAQIPVGLKSDLLRRRPDIQAAEYDLVASNADIGIAVAALYPSVNLTAGVGFLTDNLETIVERASETFSVVPALQLPIFQGGALRAQIKSARARHSIAAIEYEKTVLNALEETESALIRYKKAMETYQQLAKALQASETAYQMISARYETGLSRFIDKLSAERDVSDSRDALAQAKTAMLRQMVAVYKALGGGWEAFGRKSREKDTPLISENTPKEHE